MVGHEDARRFNQVMGRGMVQHEYRKLARTLVGLGLPQECRVLDVGTGTGYVALEVASCLKGTGQVVGVDLSESMLDLARENANRRGLERVTTWEKGSAEMMPFEDREFDGVISSGSLHHWKDPVKVFNEIGRVVKPEGRVIVRDSKRLSGWGPARFLAILIGLTLPSDFRKHYWNSIRSSYSPSEVRSMVARSSLSGSRLVEESLDMMIIK